MTSPMIIDLTRAYRGQKVRARATGPAVTWRGHSFPKSIQIQISFKYFVNKTACQKKWTDGPPIVIPANPILHFMDKEKKGQR